MTSTVLLVTPRMRKNAQRRMDRSVHKAAHVSSGCGGAGRGGETLRPLACALRASLRSRDRWARADYCTRWHARSKISQGSPRSCSWCPRVAGVP